MGYCLHGIKGPDTGRRIRLTRGRFGIVHGPDGARLAAVTEDSPRSDVVLTVDEHGASLSDGQGGVSAFVNGVQVTVTALGTGDVLRVGTSEFRLETVPEPSDAPPAAPAAAPPPATDRLAGYQFGPYRLHGQLGVGGMGRVFAAVDDTGAAVALKILRTHGLDAARLAGRCRRLAMEAESLRSVRHAHVVGFRGVGTVGRQPYLAMELLQGPDLGHLLRGGTALPYREVERILFQLCAAVAAVHAAGVIHRDIKPSNVVLHGPQRTVKLTDFGLARPISRPDAESEEAPAAACGATAEGKHPGTPLYMSPEQVRGQPLDMRSDIWALGVVLYQLVAGGLRPFDGETRDSICEGILSQCPPPLPSRVPAYVRSAVYRCLLKPPGWRFSSAIELMESLHERRVEQVVPVGFEGPRPFSLTGCPCCGAEEAPQDGTCAQCGANLRPVTLGRVLAVRIEGHAQWACASCGQAAQRQDTSCWRCGREFRAQPTQAARSRLAAAPSPTARLRPCPGCEGTIDAERTECPTCGLHLTAVAQGWIGVSQTPPRKLYCGHCGEHFTDAATGLCAHCGFNFVTGKRHGLAWQGSRSGVSGQGSVTGPNG